MDLDVRRISKPGSDLTFPTYVVGEVDRGVDDLRVAVVTTPQSTLDQVFLSIDGKCGCNRRDWRLCSELCFRGIWRRPSNLDRDPSDWIGMR